MTESHTKLRTERRVARGQVIIAPPSVTTVTVTMWGQWRERKLGNVVHTTDTVSDVSNVVNSNQMF